MKIYFINSKEKQCGGYQYGLRFWEAIKDTKLDIQYFEIENIDDFLSLDFSKVDILFFNWIEGGETGPFAWFTHPIADYLKKKKITTITIQHTEICFTTRFDYFISQNPVRNGFPRPLYNFDLSSPKPKNEITNICTFGFASHQKKFDKVVELVNSQFDKAKINMHLTNAFYGDRTGEQLDSLLKVLNSIPRKPGIELNITTNFLSNSELLNFIRKNDLVIMAYELQPINSSTVDYILSTDTPIAITSAGAFSHVYTEEIDIDKHKLQDILDFNLRTNYTQQFRETWSSENLRKFFEESINKIKDNIHGHNR